MKQSYPPRIYRIKRLLLGIFAKPFLGVPFVARYLNKFTTNYYSLSALPRPHGFSLWSAETDIAANPSDFVSWPSMTERRFFSRHLGPDRGESIDKLPGIECLTGLSVRNGEMEKGRSNLLFMMFAQWFTDGLFRSEYKTPRTTSPSQQIDLSSVYGLSEEDNQCLRSGTDGKMKLETFENGEELPPLLCEEIDGGVFIKKEFEKLWYAKPPSEEIEDGSNEPTIFQQLRYLKGYTEAQKLPNEQLLALHATGLTRGSGTLGNLLMTTLFLREHNNICDAIKHEKSLVGDDEKIFQTARMINIVVLMKLVVSEYIAHISGHSYIQFDPTFSEDQKWYREPRLPAEFNLLYRWHGMVPDSIEIGDSAMDPRDISFLRSCELSKILASLACQHAGSIQMGNVPQFLKSAEYKMFEHSRNWRLKSFNEYRKAFGLKPLSDFKQLTDDQELMQNLSDLYDEDIDRLELVVGLFAEKKHRDSILGRLLAYMVAYDAFTNIYTNPLLTQEYFSEKYLSSSGMKWITETDSLAKFLSRNVPGTNSDLSFNAKTS